MLMNTTELKNIVQYFQLHNCIVLPDDTCTPKQSKWLFMVNKQRLAAMHNSVRNEGFNRVSYRKIPMWAAKKSYRYFTESSSIVYETVDGVGVFPVVTQVASRQLEVNQFGLSAHDDES